MARTGATAYLPAGSGVAFAHHALADGEVVRLGNTEVRALATPGHAPAHHAYVVADHSRAAEPWLVLTGDALLVGDVGRPDLHAHGAPPTADMARDLRRSLTERLLALPTTSSCTPGTTRARSADAVRRPPGLVDRLRASPQPRAALESEDAFVRAVVHRLPPAPERQAAIVAANRAGRALSHAA